jgi:anti-sigma B factor antagonist
MAHGSLLELETTCDGTSTTIRATGVLDLATVEHLVEGVRPGLVAGRAVVIDLAGITMCDSTGLGGLVALERQARAEDASVVLRGPKGHVALMLSMTGVDRVIQVVPRTEDDP